MVIFKMLYFDFSDTKIENKGIIIKKNVGQMQMVLIN